MWTCVKLLMLSLKYRTACLEKEITLIPWYPWFSPQFIADKEKLIIVLNNLAGNALKFTPVGVEAWTYRQETWEIVSRSGWKIQVSGSRKKNWRRYFDKFYQVDSTSRRKIGGASRAVYSERDYPGARSQIHVESKPGEVALQFQVEKGGTMKKYYIILFAIILFAGLALYETTPSKKRIMLCRWQRMRCQEHWRTERLMVLFPGNPSRQKLYWWFWKSLLLNLKRLGKTIHHAPLHFRRHTRWKYKNSDRLALVKGTRFINDPANREKVLDTGKEFSGLDRERVLAALNNTLYVEFPDIGQTKKD